MSLVHKVKRIETKDWIVMEMAGDLSIYKKIKGKKFDPTSAEQHRGSLVSEEPKWQPASIQVVKDDMKDMEESNVAIFFDESDLKRKEWGNKDLPK